MYPLHERNALEYTLKMPYTKKMPLNVLTTAFGLLTFTLRVSHDLEVILGCNTGIGGFHEKFPPPPPL